MFFHGVFCKNPGHLRDPTGCALEQFESREAENKYKMKYRITKEGRECLANWKVTLTAYADAISELVGRMEEKEAKGYQL